MSIEVIKRKQGTSYRAVFCYQNKRQTRSFQRKSDAHAWLMEQYATAKSFRKTIVFVEAADQWLLHHAKPTKSPDSYYGDQRMVESYFKPFFGRTPLDQIGVAQVIAFRSKMIEGRSNATVNRILETLSPIFSYHMRLEYIDKNPVALAGKLPRNETPFDFWSFDETDTFLTHCQEKYSKQKIWVYRLYLLALNTGLRWGEINALQWDRVCLEKQLIIVSRTVSQTTKKIVERTKGRRVRHVGINSCLLPALTAQRQSSPGPLVFGNGHELLDLHNFKRDHFEKDIKSAGLKRIRFHDLRHTFASHFAMRGGNLYDLQKLLGHRDLRTTERYAHLLPEYVASKTELIAIAGGRSKVVQLNDRRRETA